MVPGSTLREGSNFIRLILMPRASSRQPMEAAARPLPSEDTTPPVTKMYFADISASAYLVVLIGHACGARLSIAGMGGGGQWACWVKFQERRQTGSGGAARFARSGRESVVGGGGRGSGLLLLLAEQFC